LAKNYKKICNEIFLIFLGFLFLEVEKFAPISPEKEKEKG
jgi:hypothetical protein